jgi:predicted hydrocarbon binding protein
VRRREADLEIHGSIFCGVRDRVPSPLCQFHASATKRVLGQLGIDAQVKIAACQATGDGACRVHIDMNPTTEVPA